jgi:uncharacterized metal-binding protein YceD (DUF177 family)
VKSLKEFDIDLINLADKRHDYQYVADNAFFALFEHSLVEVGKCTVHLDLTKSETMLIGEFDIQGTIELTCDRSLDLFDYPIATQAQIIFKYGEQTQELSDEIVVIPRSLATLNVAQYIYEFIGLCIPMKKLHPRFVNEVTEEDSEDDILIYSSATTEEDSSEDGIVMIDPRWEDLKKLIK